MGHTATPTPASRRGPLGAAAAILGEWKQMKTCQVFSFFFLLVSVQARQSLEELTSPPPPPPPLGQLLHRFVFPVLNARAHLRGGRGMRGAELAQEAAGTEGGRSVPAGAGRTPRP